MKAEFYKVRGTAMKFISANYPITFNSLFDYGFGSNYMWVRERESHKPLLLVEF